MSSMFLITADLRQPGQNYALLYAAIAKLPGAFRYQQSSWFVFADTTAIDLRNYLRSYVDHNDKLMVALVSQAAYVDSELFSKMAENGYPVIAA